MTHAAGTSWRFGGLGAGSCWSGNGQDWTLFLGEAREKAMLESHLLVYLGSNLDSSSQKSQDLPVPRVYSTQSVVLRATGVLESWTGCPQQGHGRRDASQRSLSDTGVRRAENEHSDRGPNMLRGSSAGLEASLH